MILYRHDLDRALFDIATKGAVFQRNYAKLIRNKSYYTLEEGDYKLPIGEDSPLNTLVTETSYVFVAGGKATIFDKTEIHGDEFIAFVTGGASIEELSKETCTHCGCSITGRSYPTPVRPYEGRICTSCMKAYDNIAIKQYTFKPEPVFYGESKDGLYLGTEIEIQVTSQYRDSDEDEDEDCDENDNAIHHARGVSKVSKGFAYCKSDASIGGGFEVVTHPFTLAMEKRNGMLKSIFEYLNSSEDMGAGQEDNVTSCGIHFHVSQKAVSKVARERIIKFFTSNPEFILKVSKRRSMSRLNEYSSLVTLDSEGQTRAIVDHIPVDSSHYSAIHVTDNTIEFRIFNSTRRYDYFIGYVQFIYGLIQFFSKRDGTVADFMRFMKKYEQFTKNYGEKVCA